MQFEKRLVRSVLVIALLVMLSTVAHAQQKGVHAACPTSSGGSTIYWLFVNSETGQCDEISKDVYECRDSSSDARISCAAGCEFYKGNAGCQIKTRIKDSNLSIPNLDVQCPSGSKFRLRDTADGAACSLDRDKGITVGATCRVGSETTASLTCASGCQQDGGTAVCEIL